jgi:predicted lipid-binding transport protein (Tim44 family)
MFRRGPYWGGPFMRRGGFPLLFPMGGLGMGMGMGMGGFGMGNSLLGDLAAGGIGYMLGSRSAQQQAQQAPQYQPPPQYQAPQYQPPAPQYQPSPQYQAPQYQPPVPQYQPPAAAPSQQAQPAQEGNERLAQLKLLGHLRDSGMLTNDEFEAEKQKILHG